MVFSRYVDGAPQVKIINWNDENISFTVVLFMFYLYSTKSQNICLKVRLYRKVKTQQSDDPLRASTWQLWEEKQMANCGSKAQINCYACI